MKKKVMVRKPLFIGFILLLLLGLVWLLTGPAGGVGERDFGLDGETAVSAVEIHDPNGERVVIRLSPRGEWMVNDDTRANMAALRDLLSTLRRVRVRRPVPSGSAADVVRHMDRDGLHVKVFAGHSLPGCSRFGAFSRTRVVRHFIVGENTDDGKGTYMKMVRSDNPYEVYLPGIEQGIREVFASGMHVWTDPFVVNYATEEIRCVGVRHKNGNAQSFSLARTPGGGFLLKDAAGERIPPEMTDSLRLVRFMQGFAHLKYERALPGSASSPPPDMLSAEPFLEMRLHYDDGCETQLRFFYRRRPDDGSLVSEYKEHDPNRFYLRAGSGDYSLAQYAVCQPVIRKLDFFLRSE